MSIRWFGEKISKERTVKKGMNGKMNILVTGAKGMVGTALVNNLKNIRDNKNRTRSGISIGEIYEYDLNSTPEELDV